MYLYQDHSDADLVTLLSQGDKAAFEAIYRRYAGDLYKYARKNIALKEDCEELIQDLFETLWTRRDKLSIQSLKHYLFSSIRYMIIRYFRHKGVERRYIDHFKLFEAFYDPLDATEKSPEAIHAMIIRSLEGLPERCQVAIRLRLVENLSNSEIAERMHISKRTVELYMFRAFNHIRATYPGLLKTGLA